MKVIVYCEGRSDRLAMTTLFQSLIERKQQAGIAIDFTAIERGDGKKSVLLEVPRRAASILLNQWQDTYVIALPDLYPRNKAFPHESAQELIDGIFQRFTDEIERKDHKIDKRLLQRFKAFCFKYELEALLLAAEESLAERLKVPPSQIAHRWQRPVEDQNHEEPPSRIVAALFNEFGSAPYDKVSDAPWILNHSDYRLIQERCPQQFSPFVKFLETL